MTELAALRSVANNLIWIAFSVLFIRLAISVAKGLFTSWTAVVGAFSLIGAVGLGLWGLMFFTGGVEPVTEIDVTCESFNDSATSMLRMYKCGGWPIWGDPFKSVVEVVIGKWLNVTLLGKVSAATVVYICGTYLAGKFLRAVFMDAKSILFAFGATAVLWVTLGHMGTVSTLANEIVAGFFNVDRGSTLAVVAENIEKWEVLILRLKVASASGYSLMPDLFVSNISGIVATPFVALSCFNVVFFAIQKLLLAAIPFRAFLLVLRQDGDPLAPLRWIIYSASYSIFASVELLVLQYFKPPPEFTDEAIATLVGSGGVFGIIFLPMTLIAWFLVLAATGILIAFILIFAREDISSTKQSMK